jgi:hypothetical protein
MAVYRTMTVDGGYGSDVTADTDAQAKKLAKQAGYKVLDITEHNGELVLVIAD